jgi:hypothetical protein
MYGICLKIGTGYLKKYCASKKVELDIDMLAHDAALYVIEQHLRKPEWRVENIHAYMRFGVMKALFRDAHKETLTTSYEQAKGL